MEVQADPAVANVVHVPLAPRRAIRRFGPKLGKAKRITITSIGPFPKKQAEQIADKGYRRLLSEGCSEEAAREYRDHFLDVLVTA